MSIEKKCLVLVAHADDETLGAGATMPKLLRQGWDVRVVVLADGIVRARGGETDNRPGAMAAASVLGIEPFRFMGFPDQRFDTVPMVELAGAVGALGLEPDLVITHSPTDLNQDHRLACEVARIIARPLGKPVSILGCEIPGTSQWNTLPFSPNYFVDVSTTIDCKIKAFEQYTLEIQPYPHPCSSQGLRMVAQYHGMLSGYPMAEAFVLLRGYEGTLP
jgi:N-acetylglucosamine malate deacetylase 1